MFPDFTKEFILDTDASFDRIVAVLDQTDENGNERVITYGSKAMNKYELGYCITKILVYNSKLLILSNEFY